MPDNLWSELEVITKELKRLIGYGAKVHLLEYGRYPALYELVWHKYPAAEPYALRLAIVDELRAATKEFPENAAEALRCLLVLSWRYNQTMPQRRETATRLLGWHQPVNTIRRWDSPETDLLRDLAKVLHDRLQ